MENKYVGDGDVVGSIRIDIHVERISIHRSCQHETNAERKTENNRAEDDGHSQIPTETGSKREHTQPERDNFKSNRMESQGKERNDAKHIQHGSCTIG